jgi:3-hydroxyisobutyrate dehydrogenase
MGEPMAMSLLKAGFDVAAYNRTPEKLAALKQAGARTADCPAAAVTPGGIVVTMVSNDQVLKELSPAMAALPRPWVPAPTSR